MTRRLATAIAMLSVGLLGVAACSILPAPQPDPSRFFVLNALAPPDAPTGQWADTSKLSIGLGPITMPDYLRRREVVTRVAANRVELSSTEYWAEPLDQSFQRVLSDDLAALLGTRQIVTYPWYSTTAIDYQVEVYVQRFERNTTGAAELAASAVIKDAKGRVLVSQPVNLSQSMSGGGGDSAAAALSSDLGNLSREIAQMLQRLQSSKPGSATSTSTG
jgi:uncharacterized lipoprotein YmbA